MKHDLQKASGSGARGGRLGKLLLGTIAALGAASIYNTRQARAAEARHPPIGRLLTVDGVRLHVLERGSGEPIVLLHGIGLMIQDFVTSGLVDSLAERFRVIAFDRPGHGYSERPGRMWTADAQAELFEKALRQLGIQNALFVGHSYGAQIAAALALRSPSMVRGLVLLSGYFYPTGRTDVPFMSAPAIPIIGDLMRYTIAPILSRLVLPRMVEKSFAPAPVSEEFERGMPQELMLRPSQIHAGAEDFGLLIPSAAALQQRYKDLQMPVTIIVGSDDQIADVGRHSERLSREISNSHFLRVPGSGHMVHHTAPDQVVNAILNAAQREEESPALAPSEAMRATEPSLSMGYSQTAPR